jgi:DNA-binding GntR family transcriptional regulator
MKTNLQIIKEVQEIAKAKDQLPALIISTRDKLGHGYRLSASIKILDADLIITPIDNNIISMKNGDPVLHIEQIGRCWSKDEALQLAQFINECFGE